CNVGIEPEQCLIKPIQHGVSSEPIFDGKPKLVAISETCVVALEERGLRLQRNVLAETEARRHVPLAAEVRGAAVIRKVVISDRERGGLGALPKWRRVGGARVQIA